MKLLVLFLYISISYAWGPGDLEKYGPLQLALRSSLIKCDHNRSLNLNVSEINVFFYDFPKNYTAPFAIDEAGKGILAVKNLDKTKKFIVFVSGYKTNISGKIAEHIRDTFRDLNNSYLVIFDHSAYTHGRNGEIKSYERSVRHVHYIGKALGHMLLQLKDGGISPKNIHCIGYSLGSQILGQAGEIFFDNTGMKVARITAIDPAGPCFSNSLIQEQVRSGVADYVEVYHCNAGGLGTSSVLGDIDFFVNRKGHTQPYCETPFLPGIFDSANAAQCNHNVCVVMWTSTVKNPSWFLATKCDSYRKFEDGKCAANEVTIAGFWNPGNATGVFYFSTKGYDFIQSLGTSGQSQVLSSINISVSAIFSYVIIQRVLLELL